MCYVADVGSIYKEGVWKLGEVRNQESHNCGVLLVFEESLKNVVPMHKYLVYRVA